MFVGTIAHYSTRTGGACAILLMGSRNTSAASAGRALCGAKRIVVITVPPIITAARVSYVVVCLLPRFNVIFSIAQRVGR